MNKQIIYKYAPYAVALVVFILIVVWYCSPMLSGKVLYQPDTNNWKGMSHEILEYKEKTGETSYWTNSMFGGMPAYQISSEPPSRAWVKALSQIPYLVFPSPMVTLLGYFIGFFIMLRAFGVNKWLSIAGAIAIALSSYFFIIVAAGHNSKALTLGYLAPVIGGFFLIFRKRYFWGISLTMLFTAIGFMLHPQMSYYIMLMLAVFGIAEIVIHVREKRVRDLVVGVLLFAASWAVGIGTGYSTLRSNMEYMKETIRGGHSEIEKVDERQNNSSGLSLEYATQWSYGIPETFTLMIPDFMGGSSNYPVGKDSGIYEEMVAQGIPSRNAEAFCEALPMYWGDQPFTSGPVYVGAIVCFLFVLGLFLVKGPYKWALLAATLFSIFLSWGHNMMWLTELFFNYFPMYDKFRAVSSILVVAEITMPLLGFLALKAIMEKQVARDAVLRAIYYSAGITGGLCLVLWLFGGSLFDFRGAGDGQMFAQLPDWLSEAIVAERAAMLRGDALRSLVFILLGAGVLWLYVQEKLKAGMFTALLGVLLLVDMLPVDKRFFNNDNFVLPKDDKNYFAMQPYEKQLLADPDPNFRVMNMTTNTFNDARTSYYLKSVGGYHGAKLRRYQDIIDQHITQNNMAVLNMLNTKYFIVPGEDRQPVIVPNPDALGNAWFVDKVVPVDTPLEESEALRTFDLATEAVTDKQFAGQVAALETPADSTASIVLTSYAPNRLEYATQSGLAKTAVFSEIYYPHGWQACIDGQPVEHFRVNYILRALDIPAGKHTVCFEFHPDAIYKADRLSYLFIFIMYGSIIGFVVYSIWKRRRASKAEKQS